MAFNEILETENAAETPVSLELLDGTQGQMEEHGTEGREQESASAQPTLNPELTREIAVEVDAETVSKAFRAVLKKYQRLARIPGFRVGKVPETVIKNRFAKEVRQEVLDELVSARFRQAIEEQKLTPVSQPQLTNFLLVDGEPLQFKAAFEIRPEVDVTGYESIEVAKPETALTDAEYDAEMARVMDQYATVETVEEERELVDEDWAEIQFKGEVQQLAQVAGEEQPSSGAAPISGEDVLIEVGGANTLQAFTDALRGQKVGQEMTFEVTYPGDFGEPQLAGQTVKYDVTVKAIKRKTYPEKDEELAKQLGDFGSWDEFATNLREMASGRKKDALENQARDRMLGEMITRFQFPVPETFVQQQIDARLDRGLRALAQQGMTPDDMRKLDFNRLRAAQRDQAMAEVKASLILDRLAEAEAIEVSEDEMERELLMASLQAREPLDALRARMVGDGTMDRMREQMRREKTGTVIYERLAK